MDRGGPEPFNSAEAEGVRDPLARPPGYGCEFPEIVFHPEQLCDSGGEIPVKLLEGVDPTRDQPPGSYVERVALGRDALCRASRNQRDPVGRFRLKIVTWWVKAPRATVSEEQAAILRNQVSKRREGKNREFRGESDSQA